jgi:hypothetical protein
LCELLADTILEEDLSEILALTYGWDMVARTGSPAGGDVGLDKHQDPLLVWAGTDVSMNRVADEIYAAKFCELDS